MTDLPDDVSALLVRGIGAYVRAVPLAELPPKLKRFKSFDRPRALAPHKDALLEVLDGDRLTRARISEWMSDGRPSLSKKERAVLALAVDRPDGWAESLLAHAAKPPEPAVSPQVDAGQDDLLTRAKERAAKARGDVRRVRADADKAVRSAEDRVARLERELDAARSEIERGRAASREAEKRATSAAHAVERIERKARSDREASAEKEKALRAEVRSLRRELRLERESRARATAAPKPARRRSAEPASSKPRRLRRLPVPKGRLETDPETLDAWLGVEGVHLLVDGYNVAKAEGGFGDVDLPTQRRRLIEAVGKVARKKKVGATIVFDGSDVPPGTSRRARGPVAVEYSRPGEIADDHLIARVGSLDAPSVVVATNDKELQHRAAAIGATVATSNQLLGLIR
jgi:predicted RNA-binding protein with PIN domain